jgi:choline dehydrogenase-like flavoprotein
MPAMPMTFNLIQLKNWAEKSGIRFWTTPQAKNTVDGYGGRSVCLRCNTCEICPTGARYSPDWTFKQLLAAKKIELHDQTLVRKLALADSRRSHRRRAASREDDGTEVEYRARTFILASGYCWSPHLLLAARTAGSRTGSRTSPTTSAAT